MGGKKDKGDADVNYKKLGLKCGVEIHQQLATRHKLFCECSAAFEDREPVFEVMRKLRAVAGELGEVDAAAMHEILKDKTFKYKVYLNETCAVELDSEPPHPINTEAFDITLQIAIMLNCEVPEEIEVMRKTVLDGSNTSGFQRTALIGLNGWIETSFGKVGITNVCLEEDAAQILKKGSKSVTYGLNRLGIPLVEIGTSPDIREPDQAREVAQKIGMILRSTGKVKRGIGTIRQDLNVSVKGGARSEIKGVQKLNLLPKIVELEAKRQHELASKGKRVSRDVRRVLPSGKSEFMRPLPGAARMYPETDISPISVTDKMLEKIKKSLPELMVDKQERLIRQHGLNEEIAKQLVRSGRAGLFEKLIKLSDKKIVSNVLTKYVKQFNLSNLSNERFVEFFTSLGKKIVPKETLEAMLKQLSEGKAVKDVVKAGAERSVSEDDVRAEVRRVLKQKKGLSFGAYMGLVMKKFRGRADGKTIAKILKEELKE